MMRTKSYFTLLGIGLVMIIFSYFYVDIPVAQWSFAQGESFETACDTISLFGESTYYIIGSLLGWAFYRYYRIDAYLSSRFLFFFTAVVGSGLIVAVLKFIFGRARPWSLEKGGEYGFYFFEYDTPFVSFPSGHATTAFAIFTVLSILFPRLTWLWLAFALLMAFARIGVPDHYVSDTIAGALLGMGFTLYIAHRYRDTFFKERQ